MALVVSGREAATSDVASTSWEQFGSYLLFLFSGLFPVITKPQTAKEYFENCNDFMERHFPKANCRATIPVEPKDWWESLLQVKECLLFAIEHHASALNFSEAEKSSEIQHLKEQQRVLNKQLRPVYWNISKAVLALVSNCYHDHKVDICVAGNRLLECSSSESCLIECCESLSVSQLERDCVDVVERASKVCNKKCHGDDLFSVGYYVKTFGHFRSMLQSLPISSNVAFKREPNITYYSLLGELLDTRQDTPDNKGFDEPQDTRQDVQSPPDNKGFDEPQDIKSPPDNKGKDDKFQDTRQDVKSPPDNKGKDDKFQDTRQDIKSPPDNKGKDGSPKKMWGIGKWFKSCKCLRS